MIAGMGARDVVSIDDVARQAGVNKSTVSRTWSHPDLVSDVTRERVLRAAADLGYRPNTIAQMLATGTNPLIPLLVPDIANPFFVELARGVAAAAEREGRFLTLCDTHGDVELEEQYLTSLANLRVQVAVLVPTSDTDIDAVAALSEEAGLVTVLVDRVSPDVQLPALSTDQAAGIDLGFDHLRSLGHRHIAHAAGPTTTRTGAERLSRYRERMLEVGEEPIVAAGGYTMEEGRAVADELASSSTPVTAVLAANDVSAIGLLGRFAELEIAVPGDVSVVGFDGLPLASHVRPSLTTVHQPVAEIGSTAVTLGLLQAQGHEHRDAVPPHKRFEPSLTIGGSTDVVGSGLPRMGQQPTDAEQPEAPAAGTTGVLARVARTTASP